MRNIYIIYYFFSINFAEEYSTKPINTHNNHSYNNEPSQSNSSIKNKNEPVESTNIENKSNHNSLTKLNNETSKSMEKTQETIDPQLSDKSNSIKLNNIITESNNNSEKRNYDKIQENNKKSHNDLESINNINKLNDLFHMDNNNIENSILEKPLLIPIDNITKLTDALEKDIIVDVVSKKLDEKKNEDFEDLINKEYIKKIKNIINFKTKEKIQQEIYKQKSISKNKKKIIYNNSINKLLLEQFIGTNYNFMWEFSLFEKVQFIIDGLINFKIIGNNLLLNRILFIILYDKVSPLISYFNLLNKDLKIEEKSPEKLEFYDKNHNNYYSNIGLLGEIYFLKNWFISKIELSLVFHKLDLKKNNVKYIKKPIFLTYTLSMNLINDKIIKTIKYLNTKFILYQKISIGFLMGKDFKSLLVGFQRNFFFNWPIFNNFIYNLFIFFYYDEENLKKYFSKKFLSIYNLQKSITNLLILKLLNYILIGVSIKFKFIVLNFYWFQNNFFISLSINKKQPLIMSLNNIQSLVFFNNINDDNNIFYKNKAKYNNNFIIPNDKIL